MDILINAANILYVVAYFTTDMLRLRLLTLFAAGCLAVYFASQPVPLWNVVGWNGFFIGLNLWQLLRLLQRRTVGNAAPIAPLLPRAEAQSR
jgi:hypothetical protein